jgi:O-antigen/teichoic acid export membrane protein
MRRAFVLAAAERYVALAINLLTVAIVARLLTPAEFGVSVVGLATVGLLALLREFGANTYLVQQEDLTQAHVRTSFTAVLVLTVVIGIALFAAAPAIAAFYDTPGLATFLRLNIVSFMLGPFVTPLYALLRRELKFAQLAIINTISLIANSLTLVVMAFAGFSFMSFAWADIISGFIGLAVGLYFRPDFSIFRPAVSEWRSVAGFARYELTGSVLEQIGTTQPAFILGRMLSIDAIGLYQRAVRICELPKRVLFGGLAVVVLPVLSAHKRDGGCLKDGYLFGLSLLTALQWPCLITLILLANPIVLILLGDQWKASVPVVQIMAVAMMLGINTALSNSVLVLAGVVRYAALVYAIVVPTAAALLFLLAPYGVEAAAASMLITVPLEAVLSIVLIRRRLRLDWIEIARAARKSVQVTGATAVGPLMLMAFTGFSFELTAVQGIAGMALAGIGWLAGLWATDHPLLAEIVGGFKKALDGRGWQRFTQGLPRGPWKRRSAGALDKSF